MPRLTRTKGSASTLAAKNTPKKPAADPTWKQKLDQKLKDKAIFVAARSASYIDPQRSGAKRSYNGELSDVAAALQDSIHTTNVRVKKVIAGCKADGTGYTVFISSTEEALLALQAQREVFEPIVTVMDENNQHEYKFRLCLDDIVRLGSLPLTVPAGIKHKTATFVFGEQRIIARGLGIRKPTTSRNGGRFVTGTWCKLIADADRFDELTNGRSLEVSNPGVKVFFAQGIEIPLVRYRPRLQDIPRVAPRPSPPLVFRPKPAAAQHDDEERAERIAALRTRCTKCENTDVGWYADRTVPGTFAENRLTVPAFICKGCGHIFE